MPPTAVEIKAFVPAVDLELARSFYAALGFEVAWSSDELAYVHHGATSFLLQAHADRAFAANFEMHLLVDDADAWHAHVRASGVAERFGVSVGEPADRPWGMRDFTVADPSGVLWRIAHNLGRNEFATPRLLARRLEPTDVDALLAVYGDADAMRWVGDGEPLDRASCERWVEVTHRNYATRGYGMLALLDRSTREVIGFCGLVHPGGQAEAEIKYALRRERWGHGLATEAAAALLAHGAARHGLKRVIATVAPQNAASHRVLLKAGMRLGELRRNADGSATQLFEWVPSPQPPGGAR